MQKTESSEIQGRESSEIQKSESSEIQSSESSVSSEIKFKPSGTQKSECG